MPAKQKVVLEPQAKAETKEETTLAEGKRDRRRAKPPNGEGARAH